MIEDHATSCPTAESIRHYAAGGFDDEYAEQLENHLLSCPHCETLLDGLDDPSDALIRALTTLPMSADDEEAYQSLRNSALAQPPEFADSATAVEQLQLATRLADPDLGPLPCRLGSYELIACIGRGASGAVYRARHLKLEQTVAVKVLDTSRAIDADSFLQEMKTIGSLAHPNIVRATDAGEAEGQHFLVMEYVEGIDAARLLFRNGPLRVADACEIARQAALGLQFIHEQSLIHRDVKPSNLLVTVDGQVKLLDLGIATRSDEEHSLTNGEARPQGTIDYMAPEAWNTPSSLDSRSDMFSLGCTLYKLLLAKALPKNENLGESAATHIPRSIQRLMQSLLAQEPESRPKSMQAVIDALEPSCRGANLSALVAKASPQLAPLVSQRQATPASTRSSIFTRRAALAGAVAVGAATLMLPRLKFLFFPTLKRTEWRPLTPSEPNKVLVASHTSSADVGTVQPTQFEVTSDDLKLVNMGRPVNGLFSMAVEIVPSGSLSCGIFFKGQFDHSQSIRTFQFQTVELLRVDQPSDLPPEYHLLWSQWTSKLDADSYDPSQTRLAEVTIQLAPNATAQSLQVTCGRQGMPEILWNGQPVHESRWHLSAEGHALQRLSTGLLPTAYLGRIGLVSTSGTTTFQKPRLAYL